MRSSVLCWEDNVNIEDDSGLALSEVRLAGTHYDSAAPAVASW